ncbi:MAG: hypothetical protein ACK4EY_16240 [Flavipsychrobacter sp.]
MARIYNGYNMIGQAAYKKVLTDWDAYRLGIRTGTSVDKTESATAKANRIKKLEADPEAWKKYYFEKYFKFASPSFHRRASRRLITNFLKKRHWYEVRHWSRGLSKSTVTMMDVIFLVMTGKLKNIVLASSTYDAAAAFLEKYRAELDSNQRLINDYGVQELPGCWSMGDFTTRQGVRFLAMGARQAPRGNGNQQFRVDCIIVDDFDTDEECMNVEIINKKWDWFEKALFFTVDTAEPYLIIWLGNIIAPDCCVVRAGKIADHCEIINIRDENGKSIWPEKNSEADIDYQISKVSYEASQQEMFNNPIRAGQTFKEMKYGKCPPLSALKFVLQYADPSTSNKDKPTGKSKLQNSTKAIVLVGMLADTFYVYKAYVDNTTQANFVDALYANRQYVGNKTTLFTYIENNSLQDPFYEQVLIPMINQKAKEHGGYLSVTPDTEKKGEKWFRIEGALEPLNRTGKLILNIDEQDDPHMKRLEAQFKAASATAKDMGAPDAVEGAVHIIRKKTTVASTGAIKVYRRKPNSKRY